MCERCQNSTRGSGAIDDRVLDALLVEGIGKFIKEVEGQKAALHPEQQK
jgi:hypothetical protein